MKALLLVQAGIMVDHTTLYAAIAKGFVQCDMRALGKVEQRNLSRYFKGIQTENYDRIIMFLGFKNIVSQWRFLSCLNNLVLVEHDACQNYIPGKYQGKFLAFYKKIPQARIVVSGVSLAADFRKNGIDAHFVQKGFDQHVMQNLNRERKIEVGFIGSISHDAYTQRRKLLTDVASRMPIDIFRTNPGADYVNGLNNIRFFINCDMGFREYMQKAFEAMACGCVVLSNDQGEAENAVLGLKDRENIVFYKDAEDLLQKIALLRQNPLLSQSIAQAAEQHAHCFLTNAIAGQRIADVAKMPIKAPCNPSWLTRLIFRGSI